VPRAGGVLAGAIIEFLTEEELDVNSHFALYGRSRRRWIHSRGKKQARRKKGGGQAGSTLIEIQCSSVDPVLFSRSSTGERDLPRQCRASRGGRNSIIPEDRISLTRSGSPRVPSSVRPSVRSFFPSFLPSFLSSFLPPTVRVFAEDSSRGCVASFIRRGASPKKPKASRGSTNGRPILANRADRSAL